MAEQRFDFGFDRYDRNARLKPALLVVLPVLLFAAVWSAELWTLMGGLVGLLATCGVAFLLSRIARQRGRDIERKLIEIDGALPSVRYLRHRDRTLDGQTKARYHAFLRSRGVHVPSQDEEQLHAKAADGHYSSACKQLLEWTRDKTRFPLIANENIDYGFRRNALGLRSIAFVVLVVSTLANTAVLAYAYHQQGTPNWAGVALLVFLIAALFVWIKVVTLDFVRDGAHAYALRLLAACDGLASAQLNG